MTHDDFKMGEDFYCGGQKWRCTDIGYRVIVAISYGPWEISQMDSDGNRTTRFSDDSSWMNGPPYAIAESVFDEYDQEACEPTPGNTARSEGEQDETVSDGKGVNGEALANGMVGSRS